MAPMAIAAPRPPVRGGSIGGTPRVAGSFPVTLVVTEGEGSSARVELTIVVSARLTIATRRLEPATTGSL
jgi:hypothetical protein